MINSSQIPDNLILIAELIAPVGEKGVVKAISYSDFPKRFESLTEVVLEFFGDYKKFEVKSSRLQGRFVFFELGNFSSREEIQFLVGKKVFVENDNSLQLPEFTYFIHDLIGSRVITPAGYWGVVSEVLQMPANDVYVIKDDSDEEFLIPALKKLIVSFDAQAKVLVLNSTKEDLFDDEN